MVSVVGRWDYIYSQIIIRWRGWLKILDLKGNSEIFWLNFPNILWHEWIVVGPYSWPNFSPTSFLLPKWGFPDLVKSPKAIRHLCLPYKIAVEINNSSVCIAISEVAYGFYSTSRNNRKNTHALDWFWSLCSTFRGKNEYVFFLRFFSQEFPFLFLRQSWLPSE